MELTISVYNSNCQVRPRLSFGLSADLDALLAYGVEGAQFTQAYINSHWDGKYHNYKATTQIFPTGFLPEVVLFFKQRGIEPVVEDRRVQPPMGEPLPLMGPTPWPHQLKIFGVIANNSRGLIQAATGSGKTYCIAGTYALVNHPGIILTYRKELMLQLRDELQKFLNIPVGIFGDGKWEEGKLTVCMAQSMLKLVGNQYRKFLKDYDDPDTESDKLIADKHKDLHQKLIKEPAFVAVDETHKAAASGSYAVLQALDNAYWRYGFSATAFGFREDKRDYLIQAAIGHVLERVTTSDLVDQGILVPTDIITVDFSHAGRRYPKSSYGEYYYKAVVENDERNKIIIRSAFHFHRAGKPVLIAVQRVDHGELLEQAMQYLVGADNAKFVYGEDHSKYREDTLADFKAGRLPVLISTLISEGVDIPMLSVVIAGRGEASRIATIQLMGRGMRSHAGKTKCVYVDIMDSKTNWLANHSRTREKLFESERAFTICKTDNANLEQFLNEYQL